MKTFPNNRPQELAQRNVYRFALLNILTVSEKAIHKYTDDERIPSEILEEIISIAGVALKYSLKDKANEKI